MQQLSLEQGNALKKFNQGHNIFLTGSAGTGKSYLIKRMIQSAVERGKEINVCAMTGIAAVLLNCKARTIHSWSGIKMCAGEPHQIIARVMKNRQAVRNWRKVDILIIDEVSMMSQRMFDILEEMARIIRKTRSNNTTSIPFGGIQVIFTGDMFQLPPIEDINYDKSGNFCFESNRWMHVFQSKNHVELTQIFRQTDAEYVRILNMVRLGQIDEEGVEQLKARVGLNTENIILTKLFPTRVNVERINQAEFNKLPEPSYEYKLKILTDVNKWIDGESGTKFDETTQREIQQLSKQDIEYEVEIMKGNMVQQCPECLMLKVGAVVMCVANLNIEEGVCNGSQGVVVEFRKKQFVPFADHLTTQQEEIDIPVVQFTNGVSMEVYPKGWQNQNMPCLVMVQIPLVLSWANTIHKCQGSTLSRAEMDIGNQVFEYGQAYVALSRVKSLDGLFLTKFNPTKIKAHPSAISFHQYIIKPNQNQKEKEETITNQTQINNSAIFPPTAIAVATEQLQTTSEYLPMAEATIVPTQEEEMRTKRVYVLKTKKHNPYNPDSSYY